MMTNGEIVLMLTITPLGKSVAIGIILVGWSR